MQVWSLKPIVEIKRELGEQEQIYRASVKAIKCALYLRRNKFMGRIITDAKAEELLAGLPALLGDKWADAWIKTITQDTFFGDPVEQYHKGLKQHAKPYWNPTNHQINIFALGIVVGLDLTGKTVTQEIVAPGNQVMIPWAYTLGGKNSTLHGIAPQLRPLPVGSADTELDLHPTSYNEWCAFGDPRQGSKCCKRLLLWAESSSKLVCQKCNKCRT